MLLPRATRQACARQSTTTILFSRSIRDLPSPRPLPEAAPLVAAFAASEDRRYKAAPVKVPAQASGHKVFIKKQFIPPYMLSPAMMDQHSNTHRPAKPLLGPSRAQTRRTDPFLALNVNPLLEPSNTHLLQPFLSGMGRIQSRAATGLGWKSQRRLGKAVRRARSMGLLAYFKAPGDIPAER